MHELSIAMSIIDLAGEEAERLGGARVAAIHLRLGKLSGVVKEALVSSYGLARENTAFEKCELIIEEVPIRVFCDKCQIGQPVVSMQEMRCAVCQTPSSEVISGRDLEVFAMELQE